jgi:hypothetical protein
MPWPMGPGAPGASAWPWALWYRISHILNVAREIDNFYPERFIYHNVRLWDEESAQLLPHWKETHSFIEAARSGSSQLHCPSQGSLAGPHFSRAQCPPPAHSALSSVPSSGSLCPPFLLSLLGPKPLATPPPCCRVPGGGRGLTTSHSTEHRAPGCWSTARWESVARLPPCWPMP